MEIEHTDSANIELKNNSDSSKKVWVTPSIDIICVAHGTHLHNEGIFAAPGDESNYAYYAS